MIFLPHSGGGGGKSSACKITNTNTNIDRTCAVMFQIYNESSEKRFHRISNENIIELSSLLSGENLLPMI